MSRNFLFFFIVSYRDCRQENSQFIKKIRSYSLHIDYGTEIVCCAILNDQLAVSALHAIPSEHRPIGTEIQISGFNDTSHSMVVLAVNQAHDFILFRKKEGQFIDFPVIQRPNILDKYVAAVNFQFFLLVSCIYLNQILIICRGWRAKSIIQRRKSLFIFDEKSWTFIRRFRRPAGV